MRLLILYNAVPENAAPDERDVLVQADAVGAALRALGHQSALLPCTLDLDAMQRQVANESPDVVFNLVESLGGSDRLQSLAPAVLDAMGVAYTGVPTEGLWIASHKLLAKDRLHLCGLPTPAWTVGRDSAFRWTAAPQSSPVAPRQESRSTKSHPLSSVAPPFIVKAVFEHASFGMDDDAVVRQSDRSAEDHIDDRNRRFGREFFAEQFIPGREFNLSLLAGPDGPEVLPPAEIDFSTFPADKPRIVGYAAKWSEGTFEYHQTPRKFDFPASDESLLTGLKRLAIQCWHAFGLKGYVRVDFRVDADNRPWILEINGNPCLSPDAGFAAALERAAIPFPQAIERILADARR